MVDYKWLSKHISVLLILFLVLTVYFLLNDSQLPEISKLPPDSDSPQEYFVTAKGRIHLNDIIEQVFNKNGFTFIKNDLIPVLKKSVPMKCAEVYSEWQKIAENGLTTDAPKELSNSDAFLLNNYSSLSFAYSNDVPKNEEKAIPIWEEKFINKWIKDVKVDPLAIPASYSNDSVAVYVATQHFSVKGKVGAVIGTQIPWAETYVLANGAKHVTTIDYQKIKTMHPQMNFLYAPELPSLQNTYNGYFDFIVSFSSIEHDGLGRYGDPIDPIGDIREMNKIHCLLKPKGLLFVGFPVGQDAIVYNLHRIYGRIRLAMMFEGFKLLEVFYGSSEKPKILKQDELENGFKQYLFVLQKIG